MRARFLLFLFPVLLGQTLPASVGSQALPAAGRAVQTGTAGAELRAPAAGATVRLAIVGALPDPGAAAEVGRALALLSPDAALFSGELLSAPPADAPRYAAALQAVRQPLDTLRFPWYPCTSPLAAGGGTGRPSAALYARYLGPLYYSVDVGTAHVIVLDSEEANGHALSDDQLAWLKADLGRAFERSHAQEVLVVLHRALWEGSGTDGNWSQAHDLLRDFNHKPIVSVEGIGGPSASGVAPRVVAVIAAEPLGGQGEYRQDPARDGIDYLVLGPATGSERNVSGPTGRALGLATLHEGQMTFARVPLQGSALDGADAVSAAERATIDALLHLGNAVLGLRQEGAAVQVQLTNPLAVSIDVQLRLRPEPSRKPQSLGETLGTAALEERSWMLLGNRAAWTTLAPGGKAGWEATLLRTGGLLGTASPEAEFVVRWRDDRGRAWTVTLPRPLQVSAASPAPAPPATRPR